MAGTGTLLSGSAGTQRTEHEQQDTDEGETNKRRCWVKPLSQGKATIKEYQLAAGSYYSGAIPFCTGCGCLARQTARSRP